MVPDASPPAPGEPESGPCEGLLLDTEWFRRESGRLVTRVASMFGVSRLEMAEDVAQEALLRALQTWPYRGLPENPSAWLAQTARNLALDHLRRERRWHEREDGVAREHPLWMGEASQGPDPDAGLPDDTLRMLFVCFHPGLSGESQTALALRTLCGLSASEIAAAFLTSEAAIAKRLVRARQRIRELALPFAVPSDAELPARLDGVLGTLYLLFNEGYKASGGDLLVREELCREAIRLCGLLAKHPATAVPRVHALLALMLFNAARLPGRTDADGNLLRLEEQDRRLWDGPMIVRGVRQLALATGGDLLSAYHLEAGIAACHCMASDAASTDWPRILGLYDALAAMDPSPVVHLNRAVAVARVRGAEAGLAAVESIPGRASLDGYHLYHAVRGTLAAEAGRQDEAEAAFTRAEALATVPGEREFIARQRRRG